MLAIVTKRMSRSGAIRATCDDGSTTVECPRELEPEDAPAYAALDLARRLGLKGEIVGGGVEHGAGYAFVFVGGAKRYKV